MIDLLENEKFAAPEIVQALHAVTTTTEAPETTTEAVAETTTVAVETTTAGPDWETICALPENDLATNFNFVKGGWGVSKIMFNNERSAVVLVNVNTRPASSQYTGAAFFSRKMCGADFIAKIGDGTVTFDVMDEAAIDVNYDNVNSFHHEDAAKSSQQAFVIQWSNMALADNMGNAKKDQLYIELTGLDSVNWGNKNMKSCLADNLVIAHMDHSTEDHTPCLAWQRTVGN